MQTFDRAAEDLGNSIHLEHVNVQIPDQHLATLFYVAGLGLTRDPYLMVSDNNMWVNVGRSQFHLPSGQPQVLRGHTGFGFGEHNDHVAATCPWGNRVRCYEPDAARFGRIALGIPYVEFAVPVGSAAKIAVFYRTIMDIPAEVGHDGGTVARVKAGVEQFLLFRETDAPQPAFDGHHVQIYIANFSAPHRRLIERGLVTAEDDRYQFRFRDIVDLDSGACLFTVEHEVRSATHPLFLRPLVNRNPAQTNRNYSPGHDHLSWAPSP